MHESSDFIDRASSCHQRLTRHLASEDALSIFVRRVSAEDIDLDHLEVEQLDEIVERGLAALHGGRHIAT